MGFDPATSCTNAPSSTGTDAGVAGTGVLLSFIITAGLALLMASYIILHELSRRSEAKIIRKILLSLSDQQMVTGIGIQSVGLGKIQSMVPYHFFIIWMLSILSTATHLATLLALVNDFKRDWVLRWIRQFFMGVNFILSCVYGIIILMSTMKKVDATLPVECALTLPASGTGAPSNAGLSIAGTVAVIAGNAIVFAIATWYLHSRRQRGRQIIQSVGILILVASFVGATARVLMLSQAFGTPSVELKDQGERDWSFGQLLAMLLLVLPLLSAVEILRGEVKVKPPVVVDEMAIPLTATGDRK